MRSSITLSKAGLYANLSPELRALALRGTVHSYPKKAILINEAGTGDSLLCCSRAASRCFR